MANLPRFGRTWQRFSSLPRPASAAQPTYEPEPPVTEPELPPPPPTTKTLQPFEPNPPPKVTSLPSSPVRESSLLPSPAKKVSSPSSSPRYKPTATRVLSSPTKPASPPLSPAYRRYDGGRRVSPTASPKTTKPTKTSPPPSPKFRQPAAPLSPLTLPRSEVKPTVRTMTRSRSPPEVEQKSVLYQKTTEKPAKSDRHHQEYTSGIGKPIQKQQADVINIRGENVGAVMHLSESSDGAEIIKKKQRGGGGVGSGYGTDERKTAGKDGKTKKMSSSLPVKSLMNSNFQGVNNSLLYNSSCSHRDPGLHLAFSGEPTGHEESVLDSRR